MGQGRLCLPPRPWIHEHRGAQQDQHLPLFLHHLDPLDLEDRALPEALAFQGLLVCQALPRLGLLDQEVLLLQQLLWERLVLHWSLWLLMLLS